MKEIAREQGRRLRWLRRVRGLTQAQVAARCGVSFQQVQKYETATSRLSAAMLWQLANALGVNVQFFFEGLSEAPEAEAASRPGQAGAGASPRPAKRAPRR